jgi:tRNA1Val (adenine37-N6)-methyltransferase
MNPIVAPDETLDAFYDGVLRVVQKKKGYRFSVDALLLSRFVNIRRGERAIDLGTGCGILPLLLSQTTRFHFFVAVEIQKDLADLAGRNISLNHLSDRVTVLCRDLRELRGVYPPGAFHVVVSNPPYRRFRTGRLNPLPEKAVARHEIKGTLQDLTSIASYLLRPKGRCYLIYPASRIVDLLVTLRKQNLEPKRLQFVHPRPGEPAKFILIESAKATGVEAKVMDPVMIGAPC